MEHDEQPGGPLAVNLMGDSGQSYSVLGGKEVSAADDARMHFTGDLVGAQSQARPAARHVRAWHGPARDAGQGIIPSRKLPRTLANSATAQVCWGEPTWKGM